MRFAPFFEEVLRCSDAKASFEARLACDGLGVASEAAEFVAALHAYGFTIATRPSAAPSTATSSRPPAYVVEAGDLLWYVCHLYALIGGDAATLESSVFYDVFYEATRHHGPTVDDALALMLEAGAVADIAKKIAHHGRPTTAFRDELFTHCERAVLLVRDLLIARGWTLGEAFDVNAHKLRTRFPNGWNAADAAAKRDER